MNYKDTQLANHNGLGKFLAKAASETQTGITFINGFDNEEYLSYYQLYQEALVALKNLQRKGVVRNDEILIYTENTKNFIITFWACILGAIIPIPVSVGSQVDHKLKFIKIWKLMSNPYLVTHAADVSRIIEFALTNGYVKEANEISSNTIFTEELSENVGLGLVSESTEEDIAYVQYSSGSTGEPKGVILTHKNLRVNTHDIAGRSEITKADSMLSWMPLTHDMGLICFHLTGVVSIINQYIIPASLFIKRPVLWINKANQHKATLLYSPNFGLQYFISSFKNLNTPIDWDLSHVRLIYNGAEPISIDLIELFYSTLRPYGLERVMYPGYGLAEASVAVTLPSIKKEVTTYYLNRNKLTIGELVEVVDCNSDSDCVSFVEVGSAIEHCSVKICDENDDEVAENIIGHIQIKGENVTQGYYRDEKAGEGLFSKANWLKTGDLGFINNGQLVITGRYKNILIINGQNYYPQDIERVAMSVEGVEIGKVVACGIRNRHNQGDDLVVFILFKGNLFNFFPIAASVKEKIATDIGLSIRAVIPVNKIPKTTSGKIQHFKLIDNYTKGLYSEHEAEMTRFSGNLNPKESIFDKLNNIWLELFHKKLSPKDNFLNFDINSLQLIRFIGRIKQRLNVDINLQELYENPVVENLIESLNEKSVFYEQPFLIEDQEYYGLSDVQNHFWAIDQFADIKSVCNIPVSYYIKGELDFGLLEKVFQDLIYKYDTLRTRIILTNDGPKQKFSSPQNSDFKLQVIDAITANWDSQAIKEQVTAEVNLNFNLINESLIRVKILRLGENKNLLIITLHHIISDGWSTAALLTEVQNRYRGEVQQTKENQLHFKDYLGSLKHNYSKNRTKGGYNNSFENQAVVNLPTSSVRTGVKTFAGKSITLNISTVITYGLKKIAKENDSTLFMVLISALNILFYKYTGQNDISLGTEVANRQHPDFEQELGCFIKTLVLKNHVDKRFNFLKLLTLVKSNSLEAYDNNDFVYNDFNELQSNKNAAKSNLFNILVLLQNFNYDFSSLGEDIAIEPFLLQTSACLVDLQFEFWEIKSELRLNITFNTELYKASQIENISRQFNYILEQILETPNKPISDIRLLLEDEIDKILNKFNSYSKFRFASNNSIIHHFEKQALKFKNSIALVFENKTVTYNELNNKANQLSAYLKKQLSIKKGTRIGILVERSEWIIISVLGILKTECIYVPIDTELPPERKNLFIQKSGITCIITAKLTAEFIEPKYDIRKILVENLNADLEKLPIHNQHINPSPEDSVYILFTSGSTGEPKGVVINQQSLVHYTQTFTEYFSINSDDVVIQQSSLSFDTAVEEIFPTLCSGGKLVILKEGGKNIEELLLSIEKEKATVLSVTPLIINELNVDSSRVKTLRIIISGGDLLRASYIDQLINLVPLYNTYGPTESTICATYHKIERVSETNIIGKPIDGRRVFIISEDTEIVPVGVIGEICISGLGLMSGYLNAEKENENIIFKNFSGKNEERIYKTGDLGRWLADGSIEFIGRKDSQIKIAGYRVELSEIERTILNFENVRDVIVVLNEREHNERYLIAYLIGEFDLAQLKEHLQMKLPHYMIPARFILINNLPVNNNGKIDRALLNGSGTILKVKNEAYLGAENDVETAMVSLWQELLKVPRIGVLDNFFELGGNSIIATKIIAHVYKLFGSRVSLRDIFSHSTIKQFSKLLTAPLEICNTELPISSGTDLIFDVSFAQKRLWVLDQIDNHQTAYHLFWALHLLGPLNVVALKKAFITLINRHESLRTNFSIHDGELKQKINYSAVLDFEIEDLRNQSDIPHFQDLVAKEIGKRFNLETDSLLRLRLFIEENEKHLLLLSIHHLIADGESIAIIANELASLYNAFGQSNVNTLAPLEFQYKDYVFYQKNQLETTNFQEHKNYWINQFKGEIPVLALNTDYVRPAIQSYNGATLTYYLDADLKAKLRSLSKEKEASLFITLMSALLVVLYKYTDQEDIILGTPITNRDSEIWENQIGLYLNTLALRVKFNANESFSQLMAFVKDVVLDGHEHKLYPLDLLLDDLNLERDLSRSPLFDIMIGFQDLEQAKQSLNSFNGLNIIENKITKSTSQFDISIDFFDTDHGLQVDFEFNIELYKESRIRKFFTHFENVLKIITTNHDVVIDDIQILSKQELKVLLSDFNNTDFELLTDKTFIELFEEQVVKSPTATAIIINDYMLSYQELNEKANKLARYLREFYKISPDDVIGLMVGRSEWMIIGLLGILKTLAAYVPIDPDYPEERIRHIICNSGIEILLCDSELILTENPTLKKVVLSVIEDDLNTFSLQNLELYGKPTDLAYIIYTSATTGTPKGVMIENRNLTNIALSWRKQYALSSFEVNVLQIASMSFDVFCGDICRALLNGGKLIICPAELRGDLVEMSKLMVKWRISVLESTPALIVPLMRYIFENRTDISFLKLLISGSDNLLINDYRDLLLRFGGHTRVINSYGTTETTIDASYFEGSLNSVANHGIVPIGKPLDNIRLYILDKHHQVVPIGVVGELYIGGLGVGRGYRDLEEQTRARFIADPYHAGGRLYRTGDRVRWDEEGNVVFYGREDDQVKLRGYRIELSEINHHVHNYQGIRQSVVQVQGEMLVCYYVSEGGIEEEDLVSHLRARLPVYMLPQYYMRLDHIPLTANGKIDYRGLPVAGEEQGRRRSVYQGGRNAREKHLLSLWEDVLGKRGISINDNFFEIGGHSLKASQVVSRIWKHYEQKISIRDIYQYPTVSELSVVIGGGDYVSYQDIGAVEEQYHYPLSHSQQRIWIIEQFEGSRGVYNMPGAYILSGDVDEDLFRQSLASVTSRHEILRTRFITVSGEPRQQVLLRAENFSYTDMSGAGSGISLPDLLSEEVNREFDLQGGELFQVRLIRTGERAYVLLFNMHHIISDGWSAEVLLTELTSIYEQHLRTGKDERPGLSLQYKDYTKWQEDQKEGFLYEADRNYWLSVLKGELPVLNFPTTYPRGKQKSYQGATLYDRLEKTDSEELGRFCLEEQVSMFMLLQAALKALIYRYTGQEDIIIGTPVAGRHHYLLEDQIGFYINTLALRSHIKGEWSFSGLLSSIKEETLEAYEHQQYPYDMLLNDLSLPKDMSRTPVFDILLVLQNTDTLSKSPRSFGSAELSEYTVETRYSKFDLTFTFQESDSGIEMQIEYNTALFSGKFISSVAAHYKNLLKAVLSNRAVSIDELSYVSEPEAAHILGSFGIGRSVGLSSYTLQELFEHQVELNPEAIAIKSGEVSLTYQELNTRSNQLAHYLAATHGIGRDDLVGLMVDRSEWLMIGILGILKSGGAYVPIDPSYPEERRHYIQQNSGAKVLLTEPHYRSSDRNSVNIRESSIYSHNKSVNLNGGYTLSDLVYVIYTSGTTGQPKGVEVEQHSVVNLTRWLVDEIYDKGRQQFTAVLTASINFDASVQQLFSPLVTGSSLVLISEETRRDPEAYIDSLLAGDVNILDITPSYLEAVLRCASERVVLPALKVTLVGGEVLSQELCRFYHEVFPSSRLINVYGVTEATVNSSYADVSHGFITKNSIGKPLDNIRLYILDKHHQVVPIGVVGELYIGGLGVGRGYRDLEEQTRARFIADPYHAGGRLYRTGDRVRWDEEGNVVFYGREDDQVKLRGYRIELSEINHHVHNYQGIRQSVVQVQGEMLVCYYVSEGGIEEEDLVSHLRARLPVYMLPQYYMRLDHIPLTANGKIDYRGLPVAGEEQGRRRSVYQGGRNAREKHLLSLWEDVLGKRGISINDNFFEIGGHSLKASQVVSRIWKHYEQKISIRDIYQYPTVSELSVVIGGGDYVSYQDIGAVEEQYHYPLSHSQQRIWIIEQFEGSRGVYNMPGAYILSGDVDEDLFRQSLASVTSRHEILRTRFITVSGEPRQQVLLRAENFSYTDMSGAGSGISLPDLLSEEVNREFDLQGGELFQVRLIRTGERAYVLLFNMHHIISDGWSAEVLLTELTSIYEQHLRTGKDERPGLSLQYKDYTKWQEDQKEGFLYEADRNYWLSVLKGELPVLNFPTTYPRGKQKSYQGATLYDRLEKTDSEELGRFCLEEQVSMFMLLQAALKALIYRYTGQEDIIIGTPVAGRHHYLLEDQIGFYINTLALRSHIKGEWSFSGLLSSIKEETLEAYEHQQYPYDMLLNDLSLPKDMSRTPVFDILLVLQNTDTLSKSPRSFGSAELSEYTVETRYSKFDLTFTFQESDSGIEMQIEYNTALFSGKFISSVAAHYKNLLKAVLSNRAVSIDELSYVSEPEAAHILGSFGIGRSVGLSSYTLQELFEHQVELNPEAIAIKSGEVSLTYQELNTRSNQLAHYLAATHGIGRDDLVGLMVDRSEWLMIGILGILKSGGAYVPIDPSYPEERRHYIQQNSGAKVLLTEPHYRSSDRNSVNIRESSIYSHNKSVNLNGGYTLSDLVYVIYTSGTTGQPKGVEVEQHSVVNLTRWLVDEIYDKGRQQFTAVLTASINFDASVQQLFSPLVTGSSLVLISEETRRDPEAYIDSLLAGDVNILDITPSYLEAVLRCASERVVLPALKVTLVGGEVLSQELCRFYHEVFPSSRLINVYGVTEATVNSSYADVSHGFITKNSIGKPLDNIRLYILDKHHQVVPIGVVGELYIGGLGVGRGYRDLEEQTRARFIADPYHAGGRLYRTGDRVRWDEEGNVVFYGREDDQVKLRGYRIELSEINHHVHNYQGIRQSVVQVQGEMLVCYYVSEGGIEEEDLVSHLRARLPVYMLPQYYMRLDHIPLTANGKIDYRGLPVAGEEQGRRRSVYQGGRNAREKHLLSLWEDVLGKRGISINDNFFEIGGHSLKASQVVSRIWKHYEQKISIRDIYQYPTVSELSVVIGGGDYVSYQDIGAVEEQYHYPLSHSQQRIWIIEQFEGSRGVYNMPGAYILSGDVDEDLFRQSLASVTSRHEILRTRFITVSGEPRQQVLLRAENFSYTDMSGAGSGISLPDLLSEEVNREFDLQGGELFQVRLIRTGERAYVLLFNMHHIISDGWSMNLLVLEFLEFYKNLNTGQELRLEPLKLQYRDYTAWMLSENYNVNYWDSLYAGGVSKHNLPLDFERPKNLTFEGETIELKLSRSLSNKVQTFATDNGCTMSDIIFCIYSILICQWSQTSEIIIGTIVSGRSKKEIENLIGVFVNYVPVKVVIEWEQNFDQYLRKFKGNLIDVFENQDFPFDLLVNRYLSSRETANNPFFDTLINFHTQDGFNMPVSEDAFEKTGLLAQRLIIENHKAALDLKLDVEVYQDIICFSFEYNNKLFNNNSIQLLAQKFNQLIESVISNPVTELKHLDLFSVEECHELSRKLGATKPDIIIPAIKIGSTFIINPVEDYLRYWFNELHKDPLIDISYGQVLQWLVAIETGEFKKENFFVLCLRFEDWLKDVAYLNNEEKVEHLNKIYLELCELIYKISYINTGVFMVILFPVNVEQHNLSIAQYLKELALKWECFLNSLDGIYILDSKLVSEFYEVEDIFDNMSDQLAHIPFSQEFYAALGTMISRKVISLITNVYKVIILDCDNTLWKGIVGEEGPQNVLVDENHSYLQQFMIERVGAGFLLVLCSKNNPEDVWSVFELNQGMLLKDSHVITSKINWKSKSENILEISRELNLNTDSFIFIDDSAYECAEVAANFPDILTLQLPEKPSTIKTFLNQIWAFDKVIITEEDKKRTERYKTEFKRIEYQSNYTSIDNFIESLEVVVSLDGLSEEYIDRAFQLMMRTNQFNLNGIRRTKEELQNIVYHDKIKCWMISVKDKFGDYGLTGLIIGEEENEHLLISSFLLSCRVLGRNVETVILNKLKELCLERRLKSIKADFISTDKNQPFIDFLKKYSWEEKKNKYYYATDC